MRNHRPALAMLAILAALCACGDAPPDGAAAGAAAAPPGAYRASGNEPFWAVTIAGGDMRLERPDFPPVVAPLDRSEATPDGIRYVAGQMTLSAVHDGCEDSMSGFAFPDTATLTISSGGLLLEGCGGDRIPGTGNP